MSVGSRAQFQYIRPYGDTKQLPIFEKLILGGEYSIRGFDIRSVGPRDLSSGIVLGGNKSLLFNAEYLIQVAGPVRLVLFYDAGQVRDIGEKFGMKEDILEVVPATPPLLYDPLAFAGFLDPNAPGPTTRSVGRQSAFKTSTGAEIRFFMPVLNVPFRLIFAYNPQRGGVLDQQPPAGQEVHLPLRCRLDLLSPGRSTTTDVSGVSDFDLVVLRIHEGADVVDAHAQGAGRRGLSEQ